MSKHELLLQLINGYVKLCVSPHNRAAEPPVTGGDDLVAWSAPAKRDPPDGTAKVTATTDPASIALAVFGGCSIAFVYTIDGLLVRARQLLQEVRSRQGHQSIRRD